MFQQQSIVSRLLPTLQDCHMSYFMVPLSVLGLALPWAMLSETLGTAKWVFQVRLRRPWERFPSEDEVVQMPHSNRGVP